MPTYEYACEAGHETDARQSINADPLETCPRGDCDAPAERQISLGGGLMLGGGGSGSDDGACRPSAPT